MCCCWCTQKHFPLTSPCTVGIEIHEDVVQHCKESIASWKIAYPPARRIHHIDIIRGNALEVDTEKGECALGFDRIYIGAAIEKHQLQQFKKLLKPGGILVGPGKFSISQQISSLLGVYLTDLMLVHTVEDELVKVVRIQIPANEAMKRVENLFNKSFLASAFLR